MSEFLVKELGFIYDYVLSHFGDGSVFLLILPKVFFMLFPALLWADILVSYALFVMQNYLTKVWNISFVNAAGILNIWGGISMILPVFFLFLVDTLIGNRKMLLISSISYSLVSFESKNHRNFMSVYVCFCNVTNFRYAFYGDLDQC